jgi:hypothetical protein
MKTSPKSSNVKSIWIAHLKTEEEREEFKKTLSTRRRGDPVYERILQLVTQRLEQIERVENTVDQYSDPSWSHKQAHLNGRRAELEVLFDLLKPNLE